MALRRLAFSTGLRVQAAPLLESWSRAFSTVLPELKYAQSHEWAKAEGDTAVIGISDHAQVRSALATSSAASYCRQPLLKIENFNPHLIDSVLRPMCCRAVGTGRCSIC
jgi:hypothetical protein